MEEPIAQLQGAVQKLGEDLRQRREQVRRAKSTVETLAAENAQLEKNKHRMEELTVPKLPPLVH